MAVYINKRNGAVGELVEKNEKFKTVTLKMEDDKCISVGLSTFKRWWKKVEESEQIQEPIEENVPDTVPEENMEVQQNPVDTDDQLVEEPKKVKTEKTEKKKTKKEVKKEEREKQSLQVKSLIDYIISKVEELGGTVSVPQKGNMWTFKVGGHIFATFSRSGKSAILGVRDLDKFTPDYTVKHIFRNCYKFTELAGNKKKIEMVLKAAKEQQEAKNMLKVEKKKEKSGKKGSVN